MNILYISHLTNAVSEGPNYSVPAQVSAQSNYDNVFWWNLTDAVQNDWKETGVFHGVEEISCKKIEMLPEPFSCPDLVVFESFYYFDDVILAKECRKRRIPYIVVPRSALTYQGQHKKLIKKKIANLLFFKKMTKKAAAIHFLTKSEKDDSGEHWCKNYFIVPNGIKPNNSNFDDRSYEELEGVYIGRFDPYQKGLDILLDACEKEKNLFEKEKLHITLYGPERQGCRQELKNQIRKRKMETILSVKDGIFGQKKQHVLSEANFFIMTSRFEGMPMSLIEALSYHLPCIVTTGTNMRNEIEQCNAGWGCDVDAYSISNALCTLIKEKKELKKRGENAFNLSLCYNWKTLAQDTHDYYSKIIGK